MRLGEFHSMVSQALKRGDSLDAVIPSRVRQGVQFLERNAPLKYMETWITLDLATGEQLAPLPWAFRNFKFLRAIQGDGYYAYFKKYVLGEQEEVLSEFAGYAQIGFEAIRFNRPAPTPYSFEGLLFKFTDWQSTVPTYSHYLLTYAEDLLLYQTMMQMGIYLRDDRMVLTYKGLRDDALKTFMSMDQEQQEDGLNEQMEYRGLY